MAKPQPQEMVIAEFERPDGLVRLKVGISKSGEPFVDLRNYWMPNEQPSDWAPTKKGVRLHAEALPALIEAFKAADKAIEKMYE